MYNDVVRLDDLEKLIDCSYVQVLNITCKTFFFSGFGVIKYKSYKFFLFFSFFVFVVPFCVVKSINLSCNYFDSLIP